MEMKIAGGLVLAAAVVLLLSDKPVIGVICIVIGGGLIAFGFLRSR